MKHFSAKNLLKSRRRNIEVKSLQEEDFKKLILEDYRFLKRPVFIISQEIFIGSDKKNIEAFNSFLKYK